MRRAVLAVVCAIAAAAPGATLFGNGSVAFTNGTLLQLPMTDNVSVSYTGIEIIQGLPPSATSIDASNNNISVIYRALNTSVQRLNLSHNALISIDALTSLPALQSLDVSFNALNGFPSDKDFAQLETLIELNVARNAITELRLLSFPPQLAQLDVSHNPIAAFEVTEAVYTALLALPRLNLTNVSTTAQCFATTRLLQHVRVCVLDAASPGTAFLSTTYGVLLVVLCAVAIAALALVLVRRRYCRRPPPPLYYRDTRLSSNYSRVEDNIPVEYRISLSVSVDTTALVAQLAPLEPQRIQTSALKKLKLAAPPRTYTVYATRLGSERVDAKVLAPAASSAETRRRLAALVHEITVLATLSHPHVVGFIGFAASPSLLDLTLVTEPMVYGSVSAVLRDPELSRYLHWTSSNAMMTSKARMALEVASAVAYLHSQNIVHHEISLDNAWVSSKWHIKLGGLTHCTVGSDGRAASDVYLLGRFFQELDCDEDDPMPQYIQDLVTNCLLPNPDDRPTSESVAAVLLNALTSASS
ncbi:protein kinase [Achlya hypogyna]|uniref:Protein kinase n=1 Tax=Achlya hypogyna TaxID=1202772 RepID=A0A1V9YMV5_ACHHY|nr:protein kinase [Achlya hypogyna]